MGTQLTDQRPRCPRYGGNAAERCFVISGHPTWIPSSSEVRLNRDVVQRGSALCVARRPSCFCLGDSLPSRQRASGYLYPQCSKEGPDARGRSSGFFITGSYAGTLRPGDAWHGERKSRK